MPLHVFEKKTSIGGLGKEAFELLENGVMRKIAFVEGPALNTAEERAVPIEIVFLIDVGDSTMRPRLLDVASIHNSLRAGPGKNVTVSVYGFARKLARFAGPTNNPARIQHAVKLAHSAEEGRTRVFESIMETVRDEASRGGNVSRMVAVGSDGSSTTEFDPESAARVAIAFGIPIYPVVPGHQRIIDRAKRRGSPAEPRRNAVRWGRQAPFRRPNNGPRGVSRAYEQELRQKKFADLGPQTGGRSHDLKSNNSMAIRSILNSLAALARTEYVVGYFPRRLGEEPSTRQIEAGLKDKEVGKLCGGRHVVVH